MNGTNRFRTSLILALFFALVLGACVHWNGAEYQQLAGVELLALNEAPADEPLNADRCVALSNAVIALREPDGGSSSLNAPFSSGQHVDEFADVHTQQAAICSELVSRDAERGIDPKLRTRTRRAWSKTWSNGRELLGGGAPE